MNTTYPSIHFDTSQMVAVNLFKRQLSHSRDFIESPNPILYITDIPHIPSPTGNFSNSFLDRYCAQYQIWHLQRISYKLSFLDITPEKELVGNLFYTYDQDYHIVRVCLMIYEGMWALGKVEEHDQTHYHVTGFNQPEPYYGKFFPKLQSKGEQFSITLYPTKFNPHGYYGNIITRTFPIFLSENAAQQYVVWLKDLCASCENF